MRLTRRSIHVVAATAAFGLATAAVAAVPSAADGQVDGSVQIDVLGINDFHGRLEADGQAAGAAVLAGAVDQIRAEHPQSPENVLFAAAGDLIGASTFVSFVDQDHPTLEALTAAGLDVSAVGNHEFDQGYCDLIDRVIPFIEEKSAEYGRERPWEYLAANVTVKEGQTHGCQNATPDNLAESWTTEIDGVTVGFVGAVTEHLPELVSPDGIAQVDVGDVVEETNRVADQLKSDQDADIVVLLVHEGAATTSIDSATDPDSDFGAIVTGVNQNVDAIVSGHTHLAYNHQVEVPEWAGREVTTRPVVSAGQYGFNLNKISFTYDTETDALARVDSAIIPLTEEDEDGNWLPLYDEDQTVADIVEAAVDNAEELGAEPLGAITADFNRAQQSDGTENRGGESTLGNFVADVQLSAAKVTDEEAAIAFMNPGGLRTDMTFQNSGSEDEGVVTRREAAEVQPFANTLVTMTLTGEQIVGVLEEQWQPEGASRPFLKLGVNSELTYTYDPAAADGEHITSVTLGGEPLDPAANYRVVANSFLASGGDNFTTLAEGQEVTDTGQIDLQAMADYLAENSPVSPDYAQRAVGLQWVSDPEAVYTPGDEVAFDLSSLLFSTTEPMDATLTVSLGGVELGKADIDDTIVDTTDEVGRASVRVTVPELAEAGIDVAEAVDTELVVTLPETGTEVTVPITVDAADDSGDETGGDETGGDESGAEGGDDGGTEGGAEAGDETGGTEAGGDSGDDSGDEAGTDDGTEELPDTGSSGIQWWVIGAIIVLVLGGGLYALSRRRSSAPSGADDDPSA